jgi:hypothetical protein
MRHIDCAAQSSRVLGCASHATSTISSYRQRLQVIRLTCQVALDQHFQLIGGFDVFKQANAASAAKGRMGRLASPDRTWWFRECTSTVW